MNCGWSPNTPYVVVLFYKYCDIESPDDWRLYFNQLVHKYSLLGRILLAKEGINGTLAGSKNGIKGFVEEVSGNILFSKVDWKYSEGHGDRLPFRDVHLKVVNQIISVGSVDSVIQSHIFYDENSFGGLGGVGHHLSADEFHDALSDKSGIVLDIRNDFEYNIGHFEGARSVNTDTYANTWDSLDKLIDGDGGEEEVKDRKIFMYCTGGIRCEKASAYLLAKGCKNVYQLQGGIHRYLEQFPDGGKFVGKNYVFDARYSIPAKTSGEYLDGGMEEIVGRCFYCNSPHDSYRPDTTCTVCNAQLLVCPECIATNPVCGEYHCRTHWHLRSMYFTSLEPFSARDLKQQAQDLNLLLNSLEGKNQKNRRRTLRKQIQRVENRLEELEVLMSDNESESV